MLIKKSGEKSQGCKKENNNNNNSPLQILLNQNGNSFCPIDREPDSH